MEKMIRITLLLLGRENRNTQHVKKNSFFMVSITEENSTFSSGYVSG